MKNFFELYPEPKAPEVYKMPSRRMINTLKACIQFESSYPGKPYGSADISGSFSGLYKRGFLDINLQFEKRTKVGSWYVTAKGLRFLLSLSRINTLPGEDILLSNIYKLKENVMLLNSSMYNLKLTAGQIILK